MVLDLNNERLQTFKPTDDAYEQTRAEILAGRTANGLYMKVGVGNDGRAIEIPIGRFLVKDIYERGLTSAEIQRILEEFLPSDNESSEGQPEPSISSKPEGTFGARAARKLADQALPPSRSAGQRPFDYRERAAGEAVRTYRDD